MRSLNPSATCAGKSTIQEYDAGDLKQRLDLRQLVENDLGSGRRAGKCILYNAAHFNWREERTASVAVYKDRIVDYGDAENSCDVFAYLMRQRNMTFPEALAYVQEMVGGTVLRQRPTHLRLLNTTKPDRSDEPPSEVWQRAALQVVEEAERYLWSSAPDARKVLGYLHTVRGLTDEQIRAARLGYLPNKKSLNLPDGQVRCQRGIIIPWFCGVVLWAVRIRCRVGNLAAALDISPDLRYEQDKVTGSWQVAIDEKTGQRIELAKYVSLTGSKTGAALYGVNHIKIGFPVVFVEGEFDALLAQQIAGDSAAFVTRGSASASRFPTHLIPLLGTDTPLLACLDTDKAGQAGTQQLAKSLPRQLFPVILPWGKDITEWVVNAAGDLRAWLGERLSHIQTRLNTKGVPDSLRMAALNCKIDAALLVYEMTVRAGFQPGQCLTIPCLLEVNNALNLELSESSIRRGVKQGLGIFLSESHREISAPEMANIKGESMVDFDRNPSANGRPTEYLFELLPFATVKVTLLTRLKWRLIEKYFPIHVRDAILPRIQAAMLHFLDYSDEEANQLVRQLDAILEPVYLDQDEVREKSAWMQAKGDFEKIRRQIDSTTSTLLPAQWGNTSRYVALFLRACHEADSRPRSGRDLALITGRNRTSLQAVLQRAGLENETRTEMVELNAASDLKAQIFKAAKGRGKAYQVIALKKGRIMDQQSVSTDMDAIELWGKTQCAAGLTIAVMLRLSSKQNIVNVVQPVRRRQPMPETIEHNLSESISVSGGRPTSPQPDEGSSTALPMSKQVIKKAEVNEPYMGPSPDPRWVKAVLLLAYQRLRQVEIDKDIAKQLTGRDLIALLCLESASDPALTLSDYRSSAAAVDPQSSPISTGAALYSQWAAMTDQKVRDDWYMALSADDRLALINYRYERTNETLETD